MSFRKISIGLGLLFAAAAGTTAMADATTGEVLYQENLIVHADVVGNTSGLATDGPATAECAAEISKPLPYLVISGDGQTAQPRQRGRKRAGPVRRGHPMIQLNATKFEATFPVTTCGSQLRYYISAATASGQQQTSPTGAPTGGTHSTTAAFEQPTPTSVDDIQADLGWTVTNDADLSDGQWERGVPVICNRGDPSADFDGSGICYLTDNSSADGCNSDVDGAFTTLTSPVLDAPTGASVVSYWRWYDNTAGASPSADIFEGGVSDDAGASWQYLETVGPGGPESGPGAKPTRGVMKPGGSVVQESLHSIRMNLRI